ncbi:MAG: hypothetical protein NC299_08445 [Lachnospiraceae bacterium]|nr:hypothetical protein [Ruminococcus sp.]MCM1275382.1 hypothetical protein [Lachnospiraceae bacterium]
MDVLFGNKFIRKNSGTKVNWEKPDDPALQGCLFGDMEPGDRQIWLLDHAKKELWFDDNVPGVRLIFDDYVYSSINALLDSIDDYRDMPITDAADIERYFGVVIPDRLKNSLPTPENTESFDGNYVLGDISDSKQRYYVFDHANPIIKHTKNESASGLILTAARESFTFEYDFEGVRLETLESLLKARNAYQNLRISDEDYEKYTEDEDKRIRKNSGTKVNWDKPDNCALRGFFFGDMEPGDRYTWLLEHAKKELWFDDNVPSVKLIFDDYVYSSINDFFNIVDDYKDMPITDPIDIEEYFDVIVPGHRKNSVFRPKKTESFDGDYVLGDIPDSKQRYYIFDHADPTIKHTRKGINFNYYFNDEKYESLEDLLEARSDYQDLKISDEDYEKYTDDEYEDNEPKRRGSPKASPRKIRKINPLRKSPDTVMIEYDDED